MPIHKRIRNGKTYYQWGSRGKLYSTRDGAARQARAAYAQGYKRKVRKRRRDGVRQRYWVGRNYGASPKVYYHGTSEKYLERMPLSKGLEPRGGKTYLTDDPKYARLRAQIASEGTTYEPVIISVIDPGDLEREGRHFVTRKPIPSRRFKEVTIL